jgi:hypothetical protein
MDAALTLIAAILAVLAAVVGGKGALLARPIKADLERNFQDLITIVSETLSNTALFLKTLRSTLGNPEMKWPDEATFQAVLALENVARVQATEAERIETLKVRDSSKGELDALSARAWIQFGAILAALSAALQLIVFYRQFVLKIPIQ